MNPLAPALYRRLEERFGSVLIANQGESFQGHEMTDAFTGRSRMHVISSGEQYRISCPKCNDTRHRLYIGHRWAEFRSLVHCHNENCYSSQVAREQLYAAVFRTRKNVSVPVRAATNDGLPGAITARLPAGIIPLDELPHDHPAVQYLAERGFNAMELAQLYRLGYCDQPDPKFLMAHRRIIVPVETEGRLVGWQARFVGERNWKECPVPKYYDMPGMAKRFALYNIAKASTYPWGVLVEGVTDVWAVGPHAMALLGKSISYTQSRLLRRTFAGRPLVVMLDGDAQEANEAVTRELGEDTAAGVIRVTLPPDQDPANFRSEELMGLVREEAHRQGIELPELS